MKTFLIYSGLFLVLSACNSSSDEEIRALKKENAALKKQLMHYDNSIVITRENINKYVGALAYGPENIKTNEEVSVATCLYLHHLPVEVKWREDQENQSVSTSGQIMRYIENSFPGPGKRTFSGAYTVSFENGEEWTIPWEHTVEVN